MSDPATKGGIKVRNLHESLRRRILPDGFDTEGLNEQVALRPGVNASNVLYVPANVVDGDTITIGADTFEVDIINTDSGVNTADDDTTGPLAGTGTTALVTTTAAPATAINEGDVIKVESEMLLVLRKVSTTQYVVQRAYAGTTIAAHAKNLDVIVSDAAPVANISVPLVTTLTPAAFGVAFAAVLNNTIPASEDAPARTPTIGDEFTAYNLGTKNQVLVVANEPGVNTTATTEDFANSTDNVWASATMAGGVEPATARTELAVRVPTAAEVLAGELHFVFPFTVRQALVQVRVTATGQPVAFSGQVIVGYAETTTEVLPSTIVTLKNTGPASTAYIVTFDETMTVLVEAIE